MTFDTGYDKAALASYDVFKRLRRLYSRRCMRFQVSCRRRRQRHLCQRTGPADLLGASTSAPLKSALAKIVEAIPDADLTLQWDVCQEVLAFEGYFVDRPGTTKETDLRHAGPVGRRRRPERNRDGLPFYCCGSPRDEHLVQPKDSGILVEMMEGIAATAPPSTSSTSRAEGPHRRHAPARRLEAACGRQALSRAAATTMPAIAPASRRRGATSGDFGLSAECGWAAPSPAGCPACSKVIVMLRSTLMVERVLVVGPRDTISMVDDLAPRVSRSSRRCTIRRR